MNSYRSGLMSSGASLLLLILMSASGVAQSVIAYPAKGQGPEQQDRDRFDCYNWAVQQTGYNPQMQQQQYAQAGSSGPSMGGSVVRGAAGGAALGAVGGAIGGDAGKGAAIGAGVGGLFNGMRRYRSDQEQSQMQSQQAAANAQQMSGFNRAMGACLQARGYTVD